MKAQTKQQAKHKQSKESKNIQTITNEAKNFAIIISHGLKGSGNKLLISLDKKYVDITEKIEVTKIKTNPSGKIIDSSDKGLMPQFI